MRALNGLDVLRIQILITSVFLKSDLENRRKSEVGIRNSKIPLVDSVSKGVDLII